MAIFRLVSVALLISGALALGGVLNLLPARASASVAAKIRMQLCRLGCRLLGLKVVVEGPIPGGAPTLLVANHVSWTDVLALGGLAPITFLARHDVAGWPALGPLARAYGTLFVERGRIRQIPRINREMAARMGAGDTVALFAEATTGDGTRLRKFHAVHFAAARDLLQARPELASVTIAPAAIVYTRRRGLPLGRAGRSSVAWYGDMEFVPHLRDLARNGAVECKIRFLEPTAYTRDAERKEMARRVGAAIRSEVAELLSGTGSSAIEPYVLSRPQSV